MNHIDNIIAIAEEYRTAESAMFRQALRTAIEAALGQGEPVAFDFIEQRERLEGPRSDGMPDSSDERHLRRLLAARVGMPNTYFDDGEAQGCEVGIAIDFMREPVADINAKLRALNVARAETAQPKADQEPGTPYAGDVVRLMREAGMTFHLGLPHKDVIEQMTRVVDLAYAEASIKAAVAFAAPQPKAGPYNLKRIAWELERTAVGDGFYGNALRVAKDMPGITPKDRAVLDRYATGTQTGTDHVHLQWLAQWLYNKDERAPEAPQPKAEPAGRVPQCGTAVEFGTR